MFLVNVKEALGYTHEQTLDSSYALITGMLQEYAYLCNERNKLLYSDEDDEDEPFEWVELVDFASGDTKRYKTVSYTHLDVYKRQVSHFFYNLAINKND